MSFNNHLKSIFHQRCPTSDEQQINEFVSLIASIVYQSSGGDDQWNIGQSIKLFHQALKKINDPKVHDIIWGIKNEQFEGDWNKRFRSFLQFDEMSQLI